MKNLLETARAVAIAAPLALASVPATANEFAGALGTGIADMVIDSTKDKAEKAVSGGKSNASDYSGADGQDFRAEVRYYLEREKCYVIAKAPKNAPTWLAAIGKFDDVNERAPKNYGKKTAAAIEKAKDRLEAERQKAKTSFSAIMDSGRKLTNRERECLGGIGKTKS